MDVENCPLSDADILTKFKRCSSKTGERLVLYPELKKRELLADLNDETRLLFRGTVPMGEPYERLGVIIGCLIVGTVCMQFERNFLLVLIVFLMALLPLLNMLNIILYRVTLIYPDRISIATCLCLDKIQLKTKTIKFGGHGLYINAYAYAPFLMSPRAGCIFFRAVPDVTPLLRCTLTLQTINNLLNKLKFFLRT